MSLHAHISNAFDNGSTRIIDAIEQCLVVLLSIGTETDRSSMSHLELYHGPLKLEAVRACIRDRKLECTTIE